MSSAQESGVETPVIDQGNFERELARAAGSKPEPPDPTDWESWHCRTVGGTPLHPSEALATALIGHVRRVVVDSASNVINLGRRRRLFAGASRDAAILQAAIARRGGLCCAWPGCTAPPRYVQMDHRDEWHEGGLTDPTNGDPFCGYHNRLKHHYRHRPINGP